MEYIRKALNKVFHRLRIRVALIWLAEKFVQLLHQVCIRADNCEKVNIDKNIPISFCYSSMYIFVLLRQLPISKLIIALESDPFYVDEIHRNDDEKSSSQKIVVCFH